MDSDLYAGGVDGCACVLSWEIKVLELMEWKKLNQQIFLVCIYIYYISIKYLI